MGIFAKKWEKKFANQFLADEIRREIEMRQSMLRIIGNRENEKNRLESEIKILQRKLA